MVHVLPSEKLNHILIKQVVGLTILESIKNLYKLIMRLSLLKGKGFRLKMNFITAPAGPINDACSKSDQKRLEYNYLALLV